MGKTYRDRGEERPKSKGSRKRSKEDRLTQAAEEEELYSEEIYRSPVPYRDGLEVTASDLIGNFLCGTMNMYDSDMYLLEEGIKVKILVDSDELAAKIAGED